MATSLAPIAAVDIGTNSFHLVVAQPTTDHRFEVIDREKEMVRLGAGMSDTRRLAPDAIDRGVAALKRFRQIAESAGASLHAVATSAVREAENRDEFLLRAQTEAGVEVNVVSGVEEARLIHLGVLQGMPGLDRRHLLIDIGGGSTEFVIGQGAEMLEAHSLQLGAIRMTDRFLRGDPLRATDINDCRRSVRAGLTYPTQSVEKFGFAVAVGSSGTITCLAAMIHAARGGDRLKTWSGFSFTSAELTAIVDQLVAMPTVAERLGLAGIDPKRADIILGGAIILEQAFEALGIQEMRVSDYALREGLLLDALRRREHRSIGHLDDLRRQSVQHLAAIRPAERSHAEHSTRLALELFEATRGWHGLGEDSEELLEGAGLLANVGLFVSHDRHHLHSYYVIRHSDLLVGFTDHEIEMIALVTRYHRKSTPRSRHPEFACLADTEKVRVKTLAGILRVAVAFDRTRAGLVKNLAVRPGADENEIQLVVSADSADIGLELYTAQTRTSLLEEALGVTVSFVVV